MIQLNSFQKKTEELLSTRLKDLGYHIRNRKETVFNDERWSTKEEPMLQATIGNIDIWIYIDGAYIRTPFVNLSFEKYDYKNLDELAQAFIGKIIFLIKNKGFPNEEYSGCGHL